MIQTLKETCEIPFVDRAINMLRIPYNTAQYNTINSYNYRPNFVFEIIFKLIRTCAVMIMTDYRLIIKILKLHDVLLEAAAMSKLNFQCSIVTEVNERQISDPL